MKNIKIKSIIRQIILLNLCVMILGLPSCKDDVDSGIVTQQSIQVSSFLDLEENKELYSEFVALIKAAGMYDFLNAYGIYTCFIPNNKAVKAYYAENNTSLDQMSDSLIVQLVRGHIISGSISTEPIETINFPIGSISTPNMNEHFIRIGVEGANNFRVNGIANILRWDDKVHNGVIHTIDHVLEAPTAEVAEVLDALPNFSLFYEALQRTGMIDSIYLTDNNVYTYRGQIPDLKASKPNPLIDTPPFCKYGYTVFMESNETFAKAGITTIEELRSYAEDVYYDLYPLPEDAEESENIRNDDTHRQNALNRFVSYHMMDRMADVNEFINPKWVDHFVPNTLIMEYVEMMMPNSLIEIQTGNIINKNMYADANDPLEKEKEVRLLSNVGSVINAMFHEISNILTYEGVETNVLNKRLRIDATSMIPEFVTNKFRGDQGAGFPYCAVPIDYFNSPNSRLSYSEETQFQHIGSRGFHNMYGDEFLFAGRYDFTLTTPPIPQGRWEVRMSYTPNSRRGVAQIFLNGKPCGIPLDLRLLADNPRIGWIIDSDTQDNGVENDKMMRNRGYMKGASSIINALDNTVLRNFNQSLRRIISVEEVTQTQPFVFRVKSVMDNTTMEFMMDYMEFVPSSYLELEGRD